MILRSLDDLKALRQSMPPMSDAWREDGSQQRLGGVTEIVRNADTGVEHQVLVAGDMPPRMWKTRCGWKFAFSNFQKGGAEAGSRSICAKCAE